MAFGQARGDDPAEVRTRILLSSFLVATSAGIAAAEPAAETALHYTLEATSVSSYVWRGSLLSADRAAPAVQPYGELDVDVPALHDVRVAAGVWTSRRVTGDDAAQEIDPYLWLQLPLGDVAIRAGYTVYVLPDLEPKDAMHELLGQVTWNATPRLAAIAGVAVDPVRTKGWYGFAGAAYTRTVGKTTLTMTGNVGASDYAMQPADLQDVTLTARGAYALGDAGVYVALTAAAAYSGRDQQLYPYAGLGLGIAK